MPASVAALAASATPSIPSWSVSARVVTPGGHGRSDHLRGRQLAVGECRMALQIQHGRSRI